MTAKSNVIPALIHGVSQQSPDLRLPSHADAMTEFFCDASTGAINRPPVTSISKLVNGTTTDSPYTPPYAIETSDGKRWAFVVLDGDIHIRQLNGTATATLSDPYLDCSGLSRDCIRSTKLGGPRGSDTWVLSNSEVLPCSDSPVATGVEGYDDHLITISAAFEDTTYSCSISGSSHVSTFRCTASATDSVSDMAFRLFHLAANKYKITYSIADATFPIPVGDPLIGQTITAHWSFTRGGDTETLVTPHTLVAGDTYASINNSFTKPFADEYPNSFILADAGAYGPSAYLEVYWYASTRPEHTLSSFLNVTATTDRLTTEHQIPQRPFTVLCRDNQIRVLDGGDGNPTQVTVSDTLGNTAIATQPTTVGNIETDTPSRAFHGMRITEKAPSNSASSNPIYFEYDADTSVEPISAIASGTWIETRQVGTRYRYDNNTLPHLLAYVTETELWEYGTAPYTEAEVGDTTSIPFINFDQQGITDVFSFQSRLGFLYGGSWAFSKANDPLNFFKETVVQVADDDPIVGYYAADNTGALFAAVGANQDLLLFGENRGIAISGAAALTPTSINPGAIAGVNFNSKVKPQLKGGYVHALSKGDYSNVYMLQASRDTYSSTHISQHVDHYIPEAAFFAAAGERNIAVMGDGTGQLVVHQWELGKEGFSQNAYHKWNLPNGTTAGSCLWDRDDLYLVVHRADGVWLTRVQCGRGYSLGVTNRSDMAVVPSVLSYSPHTNLTTVTYDSPVYGNPIVYTTAASADRPLGDTADVDSYNTFGCVLVGDWSGETLEVGSAYTPSVTLSQLAFRDSKGIPYDDGRLQLMKLHAHYTNTAHVQATVSSPARTDRVVEFDQRALIYEQALLDVITTGDGSLTVPIRARNKDATITIDAPGHLPVTLTWIEWLGDLKTRSRRS